MGTPTASAVVPGAAPGGASHVTASAAHPRDGSGKVPRSDTAAEAPLSGLSSDEARARLEKSGSNEMPDTAMRPWRMALEKFWAPVPWMLEAAIVLQVVLHEYTEAAVIAGLLKLSPASRSRAFALRAISLSSLRGLRRERGAQLPLGRKRSKTQRVDLAVRPGELGLARLLRSSGCRFRLLVPAMKGRSIAGVPCIA
jgi:hypothetical protein